MTGYVMVDDISVRTRLRVGIAVGLTLLALAAPRVAVGQDWRTMSSSRQASGEDVLQVEVGYAAGSLKVAPAAGGTLYRTNLRYDANIFKPSVSYRPGHLSIKHEGAEMKGRNMKGGNLDLGLSTSVPLDLELEFGAAQAEIELGGLRLRSAEIATGASTTVLNVATANRERCESFRISVGAAQFKANGLGNLNTAKLEVQGGVGEVTLDFSGAWTRDMHADVELGLGALILKLPRKLGVRIEKNGLLSPFDSQGLTKRGDAFYSSNWDSAARKLTMNIDAALGSIDVVWID